ncbi:MAG TPA: trehalose-phosphatase [Dehalococcoidia bacterium]|nr:trehalose-phosphatase [Dehalococcoidia bacterium]
MTAVPLTSVHALRNIISIRPLGLFSDIDGTLAPIVSRPEDARVTPKCRELLGRLLDCGVRVALITGRTPGTARLMTGLDRVVYAANHGMTLWMDGVDETTEAVAGYVALAGAVARELAGINAVGVTVEHTGPNVAVHYRRAADEVTARAGIIEAIAASPSARSFRVREGRKVFELRPPLPINKGTALEGLVRRFGMRGLLCLGDDQTDVDMFAAVAQLRDEGLRGVSIAVDSEEATASVRDAADYTVEGVAGTEWLLGELVKVLDGRSP